MYLKYKYKYIPAVYFMQTDDNNAGEGTIIQLTYT